jgi:phosphatidylserine decarboxylase
VPDHDDVAEVIAREQPITCINPGGGFFFSIESAWGRLRRGWLRRFRPGYVARRAAERRGDCPACPHEIVDARDLKLWRNVCGYSFAEEERWRNGLRLARAGLAEVVLVSVICTLLLAGMAVAGAPLLLIPAAVVVFLWFQMVWFFRDPERTIPADADALISPADGRVTHIGEVDAPDFPGGRAFRISLWLSPLDVHLNRMPRTGRVIGTRYFRGRFVSARREDAYRVNEQLWMDLLEPNGRRVRVKQISGALARRLVCWAKAGDELAAGERYGLIKYGSRSDVLIPTGESVEVLVKNGDKVYAGLTILLRFRGSDAR